MTARSVDLEKEPQGDAIPLEVVHGAPKNIRKRIFVALLAIVFFCILAGGVAYVMWRNSPAVVLLESVENTLALQQLKFQAVVPQSGTDTESLNLEGRYKKGAGLAADATSTIISDNIKTTRQGKWVIDGPGALYFNLSSMDSMVAKSDPSLTPEIVEKMAMAMQVINSKNKDVWVKLDTKGVEYDNSHGVRSCMLWAAYKLQSNPDSIRASLQQIIQSDSLSVARQSGDTYEITPNPDKLDKLSELYSNNEPYKTLVGCDKTEYAATKQQVQAMLKKTTIEVKVDSTNKVVSSVTVKTRGSTSFTATLASASDVTISVPKPAEPTVPNPSETPEQYLKRTSPYLYKNLKKLQEEAASRSAQSE